jgi:nicotinate-nucleotide adenylyltransferase
LKRIGVFGGAFNPIHTAHLIIAEEVKEQIQLSKVLFIPYANPPHKDANKLLNSKHRLNMISLAIENNKYFESSDLEIKKGQNSITYTIDTLLNLHEAYSKEQVKLYLIIGVDNLIELHTWKNPEKLFTLSEVIVINRPGFLIQNVENEFYNKATFIQAPHIDISSTDIRHRIKEKKSIKYLVPLAVEKYILENKLYA